MDFMISAVTDVGIRKDTNQDSLSVKVIHTCQGRMVAAVLCDGMGGLERGETASGAVVQAFERWVAEELPKLCQGGVEDNVIRHQWENVIADMNQRIRCYGASQGVKMGTTVVAMLLTQKKYYILNVGDSRAYEISKDVKQLTVDHTHVARQVALGHITEEEANWDRRRNVLFQCVGALDAVYPDMVIGEIEEDAVYMLCSDGFWHNFSREELYEKLQPGVLLQKDDMDQSGRRLVDLAKQRLEQDNISVVLVRTCQEAEYA